jgi:hypothetical protein
MSKAPRSTAAQIRTDLVETYEKIRSTQNSMRSLRARESELKTLLQKARIAEKAQDAGK